MVQHDVVEAFLDESGTHGGAAVLAVAGYFGTRSQWDTFLSNWPYQEFHARESRFDSLKAQLCDAIDNAELQGVEVCLRPYEFQDFASQHVKNFLGNAYAVATSICVAQMCRLIKSQNLGHVSIFFEDGQPNSEWVERVLKMMMEDPSHGIAAVGRAKKTDFTQLHTADFLAHSRSVTDIQWMDRLFAGKRVWEQTTDHEIWLSASASIEKVVRQYRRAKSEARKKKRVAER